MGRGFRHSYRLAAACLLMSGCALPGLSGGSDVRFRGEATDPIGDTASVADARVPRPPDLVYARVEVTERLLRFAVRFAPGSLDSSMTAAMFELDTDTDSTTGGRGFGVGAEYLLDLHAGPVRGGTLSRATTDAGCSSPCRYAPIAKLEVVLRNDGMETVVPRATLAPFAGPLNFRVSAHANLESGRLTITTDHLPNLPARFIRVR